MIKKHAFSCSLVIVLFITLALSCSYLIHKKVWADSLVDTISVERVPFNVVYNPDNNNVYISSFNSNTVSVIDSSTNTVKSVINFEIGRLGMAYNPFNNNIYVSNRNLHNVSVIDSSTNTVISTINVGNGPSGIAYSPQNHNIYVTNSNSNTVSVIDSSTNTVISTINVGNGPSGIAYDPSNYNMYVANLRSSTVSVISLTSTMQSPPNQSPPNQSHGTLFQVIDKMNLNFAIKTSLEATLYQNQRQINDHLNHNSANCHIFNSFIKEVDVFQISGQLSDTQALELKQQATSLFKGLGCSTDVYLQTHWNSNTNGGNFANPTFINHLSINPLKPLINENSHSNYNNNNRNAGITNFGNAVNNENPLNSFFNTYENIK
ncbi:MAG TPA: YncE family protein [Verrucomicrobiae bacterium]|nr:YncE family protein [Verrucomicrobiae bacterium]